MRLFWIGLALGGAGLAACDDAGLDGGDGPGGAAASTGGAASDPVALGGGGIGSLGGEPGIDDCRIEERSIEECPRCTPIDKLSKPVCQWGRGIMDSGFVEGCGYLRYLWNGESGEWGETIFELATGEVVYELEAKEPLEDPVCYFQSYGEQPECDWQASTTCPESPEWPYGGAGGGGGADPK
jgi:hypothetical protein